MSSCKFEQIAAMAAYRNGAPSNHRLAVAERLRQARASMASRVTGKGGRWWSGLAGKLAGSVAALIVCAASSPVLAAAVACTPDAGYANCVRFTSSGADQSQTIPSGVTRASVKAWGSGGGGSDPAYWTTQKGGGGGGYTTGVMAVTGGTTIGIRVGAGGQRYSTGTTYGGGGGGGAGSANGASGGGLSGAFSSTTFTQANAQVIAAGGGGSTPGGDTTVAGGGGGGTNGGWDGTAISGGGGTPSAGGGAGATGGTCNIANPTPGSALQGGAGASANPGEGGGGGGGGYFGGGGGSCQGNALVQNGMGGGGSSYFNTAGGVSGGSTLAGSNAPSFLTGGAAGGASVTQYVAGTGTGGGTSAGGNGLVVVQFGVPLTSSKAFSPTSIGTGGNSVVTITITNASLTMGTTGLAFTDTYPAGVVNAATPGAATTCPSGVVTAAGGANTLNLSGASLASGASCTVTVTVTSAAAGTYTNTIPVGGISGSEGAKNLAAATAALTVAAQPNISITKSNGTTSVASGTSTAYTITVANTGALAATVTLSDPAVTGMTKGTISCGATPGVCTAGTLPTVATLQAGTFTTPSIPATTGTYQIIVNATITANSGSLSNVVTATRSTSMGTACTAAGGTFTSGTGVCSATDTDTVVPRPVLTLQKAIGSPGRVASGDQFALSGTGTGAPAAVNTTGTGTAVTSAAYSFTATAGTAYTLNEAMASGSTSVLARYSQTVACSNNGPTVVTGFTTMPISVTPVAGDAISCIVTNTPKKSPVITIRKALGGNRLSANDQFVVQYVNGGNGVLIVAGVPTTGSSATVDGGTGILNAYSGETCSGCYRTIGEAMASGSTSSLSLYQTSVSCTNATAGGTNVSGVTTVNTLFQFQPVYDDDITCTITNTPKIATLQTAKAWGTGSLASDTAIIAATTGGSANTAGFSTTGGTALSSAVVTVMIGDTLTFPAESFTPTVSAGNYTTTLACTAGGGATANALSGTNGQASNTLLVGAGDIGKAIVCTFTNAYSFSVSVTGRVFSDTGVGSGTPNDGLVNGGEAGIAGVSVVLTNCAGTTYASATTDGSGQYALSVPFGTATGAPLCVQETNPPGYRSTGASAGGTQLPSGSAVVAGGTSYTYTRTGTPESIAFAWNGSGHGTLNFGDVPPNSFTNSSAKTGLPGNTVGYAHTFTAGTGGSVSFGVASATSTPVLAGWSETIFADPTCSGSLQPGAAQLYPPAVAQTVSASQVVCVVMQEFIPATAQLRYTNDVRLSADFSFTNAAPALNATYTLDDVTTVSSSALDLKKEVRNVTRSEAFGVRNQAKTGEVLEYRITYTNNGISPITSFKVNDTTPAFTAFVSATAGTTPSTLTGCTKTTPANASPAPAVGCASGQAAGGTGAVGWTFTGPLEPGATGLVLFQIMVN